MFLLKNDGNFAIFGENNLTKKEGNFATFWKKMMSVSLCNNNSNRNTSNTSLLLTEWKDCTGEFNWPEVVAVRPYKKKRLMTVSMEMV